jgi:hypothetical protein
LEGPSRTRQPAPPKRGKVIPSQKAERKEIFMNRAILLPIGLAACLVQHAQSPGQSRFVGTVSVKAFGALGNGTDDDTKAIQAAFTAACTGSGRLSVPSGTYNISSPLTTGCAMFIAGDGPLTSIIFMTVHSSLNHGIIANYPLTLQDISINTSRIMADLAMVAVFRKDTFTPSAGQDYTFLRFNSSGFNFGLDVAGVGPGPDQIGAVIVRECNISVSTGVPSGSFTPVSNMVNVRTAASLTVEDSILSGDGNNDHGIYVIGVRKLLIENNTIQGNHDSSVKVLSGGFGTGDTVCDTGQDYKSWTVRGNTIQNSDFAMAFYAYCNSRLPLLSITNNQVYNMTDTYLGNGGTAIIEPSCNSIMADVVMSGNVFQNITQGGVLLLSSVQNPQGPCSSATAAGDISNFVSTGDTYINWSTINPGTYSAISAQGSPVNLLRATVSQLSVDGGTNGLQALNLGAFAQVSVGQ